MFYYTSFLGSFWRVILASEILYVGSKGEATVTNLYQSLDFTQNLDDYYLYPMAQDFANVVATSNTLGFPGERNTVDSFPSFSVGISLGGTFLPIRKVTITAPEGTQDFPKLGAVLQTGLHVALDLPFQGRTALVGKAFVAQFGTSDIFSSWKDWLGENRLVSSDISQFSVQLISLG